MNRKNNEKKLTDNGYCEMVSTDEKGIWVKLQGLHKITILKNGETRGTSKKDLLDCGVAV